MYPRGMTSYTGTAWRYDATWQFGYPSACARRDVIARALKYQYTASINQFSQLTLEILDLMSHCSSAEQAGTPYIGSCVRR